MGQLNKSPDPLLVPIPSSLGWSGMRGSGVGKIIFSLVVTWNFPRQVLNIWWWADFIIWLCSRQNCWKKKVGGDLQLPFLTSWVVELGKEWEPFHSYTEKLFPSRHDEGNGGLERRVINERIQGFTNCVFIVSWTIITSCECGWEKLLKNFYLDVQSFESN